MKVMSLEKEESICLFDKLTRPKDTVDLVLGIKPGKINNIKPGWHSESGDNTSKLEVLWRV